MLRSICALVVALVLSAVAAGASDDDAPSAAGETVSPAQEERAIEHWNKWINEPKPGDPSPADARQRALELPGDEDAESDVDRFEDFE